DPEAVAARKLAGALPRRARLPDWARAGRRSWLETGHRLLVPIFDAAGRLASLRARFVRNADPWPAQTLPPTGFSVAGLCLAAARIAATLAGRCEIFRRAEVNA